MLAPGDQICIAKRATNDKRVRARSATASATASATPNGAVLEIQGGIPATSIEPVADEENIGFYEAETTLAMSALPYETRKTRKKMISKLEVAFNHSNACESIHFT